MSTLPSIDLSYTGALEAAGATVLAYEEFGSYQGEWLALVRYEGVVGYSRGYYGSCSGCDEIEGSFDYYAGGDTIRDASAGGIRPRTLDERMVDIAKLAQIGRQYLPPMSEEEALKLAGENSSWDLDAEKAIAWIHAHPIQPD